MLIASQKVLHPVTRHSHPAALTGVLAPLLTPERLDGKIDFDGLQAQADYLCRRDSISALIVRSGPGRMWSYSHAETRDAIRCVLAVAKDRKPVLANTAGIWSGGEVRPRPAVYLRQAADLSQWAVSAGAAAVIQPVPTPLLLGTDYPPQDVALRFFDDLCNACDAPMVIHQTADAPGTARLTVPTLIRLSHRRHVIGLILEGPDVTAVGELTREARSEFSIATAQDTLCASAFMAGACAVAGPLSTLLPEVAAEAWRALLETDPHSAWRAQNDLVAAHTFLSPWSSPDMMCGLMLRLGVPMAGRSRDGGRPALPEELDLVAREIQRLRLPYL